MGSVWGKRLQTIGEVSATCFITAHSLNNVLWQVNGAVLQELLGGYLFDSLTYATAL